MPSSEYTNEHPLVNPLAPLGELVGWLASTTLHVIIGVALGMIAARVMRSHHLRWTWAASALGVGMLTGSELADGPPRSTSPPCVPPCADGAGIAKTSWPVAIWLT